MLQKIDVNEAVGMILGHDITKVIPGEYKGPAFRRGHIIKEHDIPELLSMGKEHIYVMKLEENEIHEEEAALRIAAAISGEGVEFTKPSEGRVNLKSTMHGLLKINIELLKELNSIGDILISTLHNNTVAHLGMMVTGTKIVPLFTDEERIIRAEQLCKIGGKVTEIKPFKIKNVGIVITGSEIYKGRIQDKFTDIMKRKCADMSAEITNQAVVPDDKKKIAEAVCNAKNAGSEAIIVCGGLSIDPDDVTVDGVRESGAEIISYGAPVMPGAMFLYAKLDGIPIMGAPAAASYNPRTVIDLVLPRILCGEDLNLSDVIDMGYGGLCQNCAKCTFPVCPFGKL
jgi:molybdopterin biosynthesis enzyme